MTRMQINGSDNSTVRLFHLDLPREAVDRFVTQAGTGEWPLKYSLGATALRPAFVDVVDIRDLGEMSLSQYMAEAHGASGEDFNQMRPRIDALTGHVVLLPALAFDNTSQELIVSTPLRWIGTFSELRGKPRGARLRSAAAQGTTGGGNAPGGRGGSAILKLILLGVAIVVLLVLALALR